MLFIVKILGYFQANRETKKEGFTASQWEFCHTAYYCSIALLTPKQWLQHDHNICDAVGEQKEAFVSPCFLLVLFLVYSAVVSVGGFYLSCSHLHYQFFSHFTSFHSNKLHKHWKSHARLKSVLQSFTNNHSRCAKVSLPWQGNESSSGEGYWKACCDSWFLQLLLAFLV